MYLKLLHHNSFCWSAVSAMLGSF